MVRTRQVGSSQEDENDPWNGILVATLFTIQATIIQQRKQYRFSLYLVGMPYFMFDAKWKSIREHKQCKQRANNINNQRENAKHISHNYKVGDLVRSV